jgi:hypothetical protein
MVVVRVEGKQRPWIVSGCPGTLFFLLRNGRNSPGSQMSKQEKPPVPAFLRNRRNAQEREETRRKQQSTLICE